MIAIIDYGMGNIYSIKNAFHKAGVKVEVFENPDRLKDFDGLVIPGVGSFDNTITGLMPFKEKIFEAIDSGIPFLGICMGLQALFDESEEGKKNGLGLIPGKVIRLPDTVLVPQMGWNELSIRKESKILEGISDGDFFYFVHSYHCVPEENKVIGATTKHGLDICAAIEKDNIAAVQFHPEKSGEKGLEIIKNYSGWVKC